MTALLSVSRYLMESSDEAERLEAKTDLTLAERLLTQSGLSAGMSALDAGAGSGAVARLMSHLVGATGRVVALDRSHERLDFAERRATSASLDNLTFTAGDLETQTPAGGPFDFVWCRFVFEYLHAPDAALAHLVASTRIGGKVVVADLDGNAWFHHPMSPRFEAELAQVMNALEGRFDPYAGRKLFHRFKRAGLADIRVHVEPYHLYAGAAPDAALANWEQKLRTIRPAVEAALGGPSAYTRWAAEFMQLLKSPDVFTYSTLIVVEGVRQGAMRT